MKKKKSKIKKLQKQPVERICKNCLLYNPKQGICRATILMEGERIHLPMFPTDPCFFQEEITIKNEAGQTIDRFTPQVEEVKWWVEHPVTGKKGVKEGVVKIQYPENFFGKEIDPEDV